MRGKETPTLCVESRFFPEEYLFLKTDPDCDLKTRIRALTHLEVPNWSSGRSTEPIDQRLRAIQHCKACLNVPQPSKVVLTRRVAQGQLGVFELLM